MRLIFAGTPEFAVPMLKAVTAGHDVAAVLTQPDRRRGRSLRLEAPPVKVAAEELGLLVLQPEKLRDPDTYIILEALNAEAIVVVAYGRILPPEILDLTPAGCVNVHPSLLPAYRGAAPIQRAIMNGDEVTGVTIMRLDAGMDTGPIYAQVEVAIGSSDTAGELAAKLDEAGAKLLVKVLSSIERGRAKLTPQPPEGSLADKIDKDETRIDWSKTARQVHDLVRALNPSPGAYTTYSGQRLKVWLTEPYGDGPVGEPGQIVSVSRGLLVATGGGDLRLLELQPENKKRMGVEEFIRGYHPAPGMKLGAS